MRDEPRTRHGHLGDVPHLSQEAKDALWAAIPEHERDARAKGIPVLGSGLVFPVSEDSIKVEPFAIPDHYRRIGGMDFGWDHPWAACELAHDPQSRRELRNQTAACQLRDTPILGAAAVKPWGAWLPWAWPKDGGRKHRPADSGKDSRAAPDRPLIPFAVIAAATPGPGGVPICTEADRASRLRARGPRMRSPKEFIRAHAI